MCFDSQRKSNGSAAVASFNCSPAKLTITQNKLSLEATFKAVTWMFFGLLISNIFIECNGYPNPTPQEDEDFFSNSATERGAPLITPLLKEVILDVNSNFSIRCEADEPVRWQTSFTFGDLNQKIFTMENNERPYGSILFLNEISPQDVGYYYCVKGNSTDDDYDVLVEDLKASKIYIYVNDLDTLLVPVDIPVVNGPQYEDIVIPCKPTVPNTEILLTTPTHETYSSDSTDRYDPKRGFVVKIRHVIDSGEYFCRPKNPSVRNEDETIIILVDYRGNELVDLNTAGTTTTTSQKTTSEGNVDSNGDLNDGHDDDVYSNDEGDNDSDVDGDGKSSSSSTKHYVNIEYSTTTTQSYYLGIFGVEKFILVKRDVHPTNSYSFYRGRTTSNYGRITSRPRTSYVNKPKIYSSTHGHAEEGQTFELTCQVEIPHEVLFDMLWETPLKGENNRVNTTMAIIESRNDTHRVGKINLSVTDTITSDSGIYKCIVTDHSMNKAHSSYLMTILKQNESYINISEPNNYYNIKTTASKAVHINVNYRGYPMPTLEWFRPDGTRIQPTGNFEINQTDSSIILKIHNPQMQDSGIYRLKAGNGFVEKELGFTISVGDKPIVSVNDVYVKAGEEARLLCKVLAFPSPIIVWTYTQCSVIPRWPACNHTSSNFNSTRNAIQGDLPVETINELVFRPDQPGIVRCVAGNKMGNTTGKAHVLIGDITDNMTIYGIDENDKIARGDHVVLTCAALAYYYTSELHWYLKNELVESNKDIEVIATYSNYSYKKILKFKNIQLVHEGNYECRARSMHSSHIYNSKYVSVFIHEPSPPIMTITNMDQSTIKRNLGEALELECKSTALPRANVTWYKDDIEINDNANVFIEDGNTVLRIPFLKPENEGHYKCVVANRLNSIERSSQIKITNMPGMRLGWIIGVVTFILILIMFIIYLCIRVMRERELLRQMKAAGLANFEEGAVEHINPALTLDEQADLLPYDRRFEFPREKLKLGKQLGAGAFGVVLKAHAEGILPDEKETVVAVKMVKRTADNEVMRALVSELKIMVHLGQHLNVVNLLGAVTKNIAKREVMVIVEYCRYGNVQNFLLRNRKRFINQINPETDRIDPTIREQRLSENFEYNRDGLRYVNLSFSHQYMNNINTNNNNNVNMNKHRNSSDNDPRSGTRAGRPNSSGYLRQSDLYEGQMDSCATEQTMMTTIPESDDQILSNNSVQPAWRSNYKPDTTEAMVISTSDLVSWAFQVARGMDYLSSRKVLHGDLAARNILLCEDNVVKICDFGLARSMYKSDNYKKEGKAPLPIKWLALESLSDQVFSTYTDVWSFGIVLWEFFSLAKVPYPGMDPNQSLYLKLKDGYRMEKPPFANEDLYDIMLECWSANPESRPLFHELERKFARLLGDEVTSHYLDLNEPYLRMNTEYLKTKDTDYLALMGSPDEMAPPIPRYVNGHILPEIRIEASSDDYLQMSPKSGTAIFSPTRPKEDTETTSFTFPDNIATTVEVQQHSPTISNNLDSPVNKTRKKIGAITPEEIPMLNNSTGNGNGTHSDSSDTEQNQNSDSDDRTFAKINHRMPSPSPRRLLRNETIGDDNYVNVIKSSDLSKKLMNTNGGTKDAFSNPSYAIIKTVNEGRK